MLILTILLSIAFAAGFTLLPARAIPCEYGSSLSLWLSII